MVCTNEPEMPNLIWAKGRRTSEQVLLEVSTEVIRNLADGRQNSKIGEYWGLIHGGIPNGAGLGKAHALFRGVQRPRSFENRQDGEIHAYVMEPKFTFEFPNSHGGNPIPSPVPEQSVFIVYVEFYGEPKGQICGEILYWEWVFSDAGGSLPKDYDVRYAERVW